MEREIVRLRNELEVTRHELMMYREMATVDPLTEIPNRRGLYTFLEKEIQNILRSMRNHNLDHPPLSLAYLDLNNFKIVNDSYKHEAGDQILKAFARSLLSQIRPHDQASRVGGDEFVIVLPQASKKLANHVVSRIYEKSSTGIIFPEYQVNGITFSAGISSLEKGKVNGFGDLILDRYHVQDIRDALLTTADHAMYKIKKEGKEGICIL